LFRVGAEIKSTPDLLLEFFNVTKSESLVCGGKAPLITVWPSILELPTFELSELEWAVFTFPAENLLNPGILSLNPFANT